ncbi:EF-hand domain-containing protein [Micromonospora sp. C32]|uniref:EF-hand domain-containing protein n=1 Tax=Micromonospora sp. C32 TaxID=2824877 RepID=UPI001B35D273|nr:EF-hand domain-containing protein [Micromonospora sp. C32]MBQ1056843.1 EF-hand domain-containing protein [Micromonospora sp. C32]
MTTELQRRKLEKVFASYDADGDGVIDGLDITAMAQIWCDTYGVAPYSPGWRRIHGAAARMWRGMRGSDGPDGEKRVTVAEWVAWADKPEFPEFVTNAAAPFSLAVFDVADADRDGRINHAEMFAAQSKSGMRSDDTQRIFDRLDTDRDGYLTSEEYGRAAHEFYLSTDPDAPGNVIAGEL